MAKNAAQPATGEPNKPAKGGGEAAKAPKAGKTAVSAVAEPEEEEQESPEEEQDDEMPFEGDDDWDDDDEDEDEDDWDDLDDDEDDLDDLDDENEDQRDDDEDDADTSDDDDDLDDDDDAEGLDAVTGKPANNLTGPPKRRPTRPSGRMETEDEPFPPPPARRISSWREFSKYWHSVYEDTRYRPRLMVYVYRMFPLMLKGHNRVAKLVGDPEQGDKFQLAKPLTIQEILQRWGSGSYSFRLNDRAAPRGMKEICMHVMDGKAEMNDFDNFPPIVDIAKLDPHFPGNASFVARMKSRKNWESEEQEEEAMKEVLQFAERMLEQRERPQKESAADKNAVDLVAHASRTAMEIVADQAKKASGSNESSMVMMTGMLGIFKEMTAAMQQANAVKGGGDSSEALWKLMAEAQAAERAARAENMAMLRETIQAMAQSRQEPQQTAEDKLVSKLEEMRLLREMARELGRGGGGSAGAGFDWSKLIPLAAPALAALTALLGKLAQGQGVPAAQLPPAMSAAEYEAYLRSAGQPAAAPTQPAPGPVDPNIEALPADFRTPDAIQAFLGSLKDPLVRYLNHPELTGYDFASWYIDWKGEEHYAALCSMGPETIMQVLQAYPPIWEHVAGRESKALQFITEFCSEPPDNETDDDEQDSTPISHVNGATPERDLHADYEVVGREAAKIAVRRNSPPAKQPSVVEASATPVEAPPKKTPRKKSAKASA